MKEKRKNRRPPGPPPTGGVKRKILVPWMLNEDEFEYLRRIARNYDIKMAAYLRRRIFPTDLLKELLSLRKKQGANIKP